jgi:hypothetical protein
VDTPESRALLQRTFLGFKHNRHHRHLRCNYSMHPTPPNDKDQPHDAEEARRLMEIVHSEYVSPCSPIVLQRTFVELLDFWSACIVRQTLCFRLKRLEKYSNIYATDRMCLQRLWEHGPLLGLLMSVPARWNGIPTICRFLAAHEHGVRNVHFSTENYFPNLPIRMYAPGLLRRPWTRIWFLLSSSVSSP